MAVLDIIEEAVVRWSIQFVHIVQTTCYILILMVLVPFLGLYMIDAWLYMIRLVRYYYKLRQYHQRRYTLAEKVPDQEPHKIVLVPEPPMVIHKRRNIVSHNSNSIIKGKDASKNVRLSASLPTLMDKIQEYLVVSNQQQEQQPESVLRSRDELIYMASSNDSITHTDSNELTRLHRMVSA